MLECWNHWKLLIFGHFNLKKKKRQFHFNLNSQIYLTGLENASEDILDNYYAEVGDNQLHRNENLNISIRSENLWTFAPSLLKLNCIHAKKKQIFFFFNKGAPMKINTLSVFVLSDVHSKVVITVTSPGF